MKLLIPLALLVRFSRIKIKKTKRSFKKALGDNYPVIATLRHNFVLYK